jgi:hypothetical protein
MFVKEQKSFDSAEVPISSQEVADADHGPIKSRRTTVLHDVTRLQERLDWPHLHVVIVIDSTGETGPGIMHETRLYRTSPSLNAVEPRGDAARPLVRRKRPALGHGVDLPR